MGIGRGINMSGKIQIGSKVVIQQGSSLYKASKEALRGSIGVVYSHTGFGKWWVRFEGEVNTAVLAHSRELKEIGLIDDPREVKSLAISWGANPFDSCWEGKPYV